jgi:hypothetical protein
MLGATITVQIYIHDEVDSRLNSGSICYLLVQNLSSFCVSSKKVQIKIYETKILSVVL